MNMNVKRKFVNMVAIEMQISEKLIDTPKCSPIILGNVTKCGRF